MSFPFDFNLELAKAELHADGRLILEGVASTTDLDAHKERMSESALADMAKAIGIPLTDSHKAELGNVIGTVVESSILDGKLVIKAEIDNDDPAAVRLFKKVRNGRIKAGFSVGGKITSDKPSAERGVRRVITGVELDHIMLTAKPANAKTFATALTKALEEFDAEDLAKSDISDADREKYAVYHDAEGAHFPIRPGNTGDAESALHLLGHAPEDKQHAIFERACSILGDSHPRCKEFYQTHKSGDQSMENQDDLAKSGAKFSAESKAQLKAIHDAGNDDVKGLVRTMLGDEADAVLNVKAEDADTDGDDGIGDDGNDGTGNEDKTGGVINKDDAQKPELSKEQLAELRTDIVNELRESVKELFKTAPDLKGAQRGASDEPDAYATAVGQMLGKAIRF